jgi:PAS domain S-box-containing protein
LDLKEWKLNDFPARLYLQTSEKVVKPKSFVFLPVYLVDTSGKSTMVSETVKREIVFSKMVEDHLKSILGHLKKHNILQVYFIPLSGFVRVLNTSAIDPYNFYKNSLNGMSNFADRPYFREALKQSDLFRRSNPYIDTGGLGVVVTYSLIIKNENLNVCGMIGVDRRLDIKEFLDKTSVGFPSLGKDFQYGYYPVIDKKDIDKKFGATKLREVVNDIVNNPDKQFSRITGKEDESSAFAFKINEKEIAYFVFDPGEVKGKYNFILLIYIIFILGIFVLIFTILFSSISAAKAEKTHTEVVNHLNGGLLIVDENGEIKFHNRKFSYLIEEKKPKGKDFLSKYLTEESQAAYRENREKRGSEFEFAGRIKRTDGTVFPAIVTSSTITYPGVEGAQMLIIIPSEQLERTIGARFIHSFSHALKTPVSGILLLADLMRRKSSQPKMDHYFSLMRNQVEEFRLTVTNLLGMSRFELQKTRPIKALTNVAGILRVAVKPFKEKAEKKNLELIESIPERLSAMVDSGMMQVIFNNLLDNAIKYTDNGKITVNAHEDFKNITISIGDTGIGVPEDEEDIIFEKFYRGRATEVQEQDGIGVGLYISKMYVESHNGAIRYEPMMEDKIDKKGNVIKKKVGSQFIIKIPRD